MPHHCPPRAHRLRVSVTAGAVTLSALIPTERIFGGHERKGARSVCPTHLWTWSKKFKGGFLSPSYHQLAAQTSSQFSTVSPLTSMFNKQVCVLLELKVYSHTVRLCYAYIIVLGTDRSVPCIHSFFLSFFQLLCPRHLHTSSLHSSCVILHYLVTHGSCNQPAEGGPF